MSKVFLFKNRTKKQHINEADNSGEIQSLLDKKSTLETRLQQLEKNYNTQTFPLKKELLKINTQIAKLGASANNTVQTQAATQQAPVANPTTGTDAMKQQ